MPNTSHYDIAQYWCGKFISKDGRVIDAATADFDDEYIADIETVPCCWGCGETTAERSADGYKDPDEQIDGDLKKCWNSKRVAKKLNRCHIIPAALGGEDTPSNLFLLCEECHALSPDTKNPKGFFRWVWQRRKEYKWGSPTPTRIFRELEKLLKQSGYTVEEICREIGKENANMDGLKEYLDSAISLHGFGISESSIYSAAVDFMLMKANRF